MKITGDLERMEEQYRLYPVTIVQARYSGTYEDGLWCAFLSDPDTVPEEAFSDDVTCATWWGAHAREVGVGDTPDDALTALKRRYTAGTIRDFSRYARGN